jgi:hypothetical protein
MMQSDLALFMATHAMEEGRLAWSLRHAEHKNTAPARQLEASSMIRSRLFLAL